MKKFLKIFLLRIKFWGSKINSSQVSLRAEINRGVIIYRNVLIGGKCKIGDYTYISENSRIYSNTHIGKFCSIAPNVIINPGEHNIYNISTHPLFYDNKWNNLLKSSGCINKSTIIGNDVWIGFNAIIKSCISIGNGAIVGAGSVVTKDVPPYSVVAGVPAKVIKYRFLPAKIDYIQSFKWWDEDIETIKKIAVEMSEKK